MAKEMTLKARLFRANSVAFGRGAIHSTRMPSQERTGIS
jgi:hypothetical protein